MRLSIMLAALAACGSTDTAVPANGPAYTPGVQYALHGVAPDCMITKPTEPGVKKQLTCTGRAGKMLVYVGDGDHLRRLTIELRSTTLPQAKAHLEPALASILGQPELAALGAQLDKMATGDSATLQLGVAHAAVAAKGPSQMFPEYSLDLTW